MSVEKEASSAIARIRAYLPDKKYIASVLRRSLQLQNITHPTRIAPDKRYHFDFVIAGQTETVRPANDREQKN